jgi:hypothetical protein
MGKKWLSVFVILLSFWLSSCSPPSNNDEQAETAPPPPPTPEETKAKEPKENKEKETTPRVAVSGLIPPTDPDQRVETVAKGVANPFQVLPPQPVVKLDENQLQTPGEETGETGKLPPEPPPETLPPQGTTSQGEETQQTGPNLELAKSVVVTGIVTLGDNVQIILKAPKEEFSRYVQVGQYISDGQVLIKRVEQADNRAPYVVLEQSGVEVRKPIGIESQEKATTS